jgi:hypothetical protein
MDFPAAALVRRSLVVLFALHVAIGPTLASAQTVIVRHTTPGATVELVLDATQVGTAKADIEGTATVVATNKMDVPLDVNVWVDTCDDAHRVILARPGAKLIAAAACRRTQIPGLYLVQRITSIVIDLRVTSLLLRQGRAPDGWLHDPRPAVAKASAEPLPPLTGLTLFGAAGRSATLNFESQSCGDVTSCSGNGPIPYSGGIGWWFNDFVGAEARYSYLAKQTAEASDDAFQFTTTREGGVLAFTGRAGLRTGRFRPFGRAGIGLHRATLTTTQTLNDTTVVINDVEQTAPGGTQILQMRTRGWAPVYGGGVEVWLSPLIGIYGEVQRIGVKGTDDRGSGIKIEDAVITAQVGLAIRFP